MICVVAVYYRRGKSGNDYEYKENVLYQYQPRKKELSLAKIKQYIT